MSYTHLTRMGVYKFHKSGSAKEARDALVKYLDSFHLSNADRRAQAEDNLNAYIDWATLTKPTVVHVAPSVRIELGSGLYTSGQVHRVDIDLTSGGYRAVMLGTGMLSSADPRCAVIQHGYASLIGRDVGLVMPTHQNMDGTSLASFSVSTRRIKDTLLDLSEAARVAASVLSKS